MAIATNRIDKPDETQAPTTQNEKPKVLSTRVDMSDRTDDTRTATNKIDDAPEITTITNPRDESEVIQTATKPTGDTGAIPDAAKKGKPGIRRGGLKRTDHALYPMALRSLNQAILYHAETYFIEDELLSAMTIDHSLYHLSVFLLFISSFSLSERRKYRIIKKIEQLTNEPSRIVNQISFDTFIRKFEEGGAPQSILDFLSRWRKLRQFVNFGFSVRFTEGGLKVEDIGDLKKDLKAIRKSLAEVFSYAIRTACLSCPDSGRFMLNTLNLSKKFFVNPDHLYGQYCSKAILEKAEQLQQKLMFSVKMEMLDSQ